MIQAQILQHQQQQEQQRQQQEQQLQWDQQHLLLRTEQERQQRQQQQWPSHPLSAHLQLQRAWVRNAGPSAEVAGLTSQLLVDRRHQQHYHQQQQQQQAEQQHQISAGVEAAIATAPPAATREIQYATKLLQDWYPAIELDGTGWYDLADFLAQPALVLYQQQAT